MDVCSLLMLLLARFLRHIYALQLQSGISTGDWIAMFGIGVGVFIALITRGIPPSQWRKDVDSDIGDVKSSLKKLEKEFTDHVLDETKKSEELNRKIVKIDTNVAWLVKMSPYPNKPEDT